MERKYFNPCSILVHLLLVALGSCQKTVDPLTVSGTKFVKDGPSATGQFEQWEISYYAKNYLPICGMSLEAEGADYWSNSPECELAMQRFNSTSVKTGIYDEAGVARNELGNGQQLCMCFGVKHQTGVYLDICLLVGRGLEVLERPSPPPSWLVGTNDKKVAVGLQSPELNGDKMLPDCAEISISASPAATASSTNTPTYGAPSSSKTASDSNSGDGEDKKKGLTTEAIIGIAVGLPGAVLAIVTLIILVRRRGGGRLNMGYH